MFIYPRIKDLREDKDLNQEEVAKLLDTSQKQYSRWERGEAHGVDICNRHCCSSATNQKS